MKRVEGESLNTYLAARSRAHDSMNNNRSLLAGMFSYRGHTQNAMSARTSRWRWGGCPKGALSVRCVKVSNFKVQLDSVVFRPVE